MPGVDVSERFMVVPFSGGLWKILDMKLGRYTRAYDTERQAKRYAGRRNSAHRRVNSVQVCVVCWSPVPCECGSQAHSANVGL